MGFRARQAVVLGLTAIAVALATALISAAILVRQHLHDARDQAELVARTVYHLASGTIRQHELPAVGRALAEDPALRELAAAVIGYSPIVVYVAIVDRDGVALLHSDVRLRGRRLPYSVTFAELEQRGAPSQIAALFRGTRALSVAVPFSADGTEPFGSVRVGVSTALLRTRLLAVVAANATVAGSAVVLAFLAAFLVAQRLLAPIDRLRAELARIVPPPGQPPLDLRSAADVSRLVDFFATIGERLIGGHSVKAPPGGTLGALLDESASAVIVLDRRRRVVGINEKARGLLGPSKAALDGTSLDRLLSPGDPLCELVAETLGDGEVRRSRSLTLVRDGREARYLVDVETLRESGAVVGATITARDLDALSRLGSRLSDSRKLDGLGRLTSAVAHEIRNPLNALVLQAELLRHKLDGAPPEVARHLDVVEQELRRVDRVIDGFLKFLRPEDLRLEPVDLGVVVREALDLTAARAAHGGVSIESRIDPDLPTARGSAELLRQALLNLLTNALDAMNDGGSLSVRGERQSGGAIALTVEDTGAGITSADLPRVFDPFYTTRERGTGLGLPLVHRIVELHGGEVRVDSESGSGTRVTLTLPGIGA